MKKYLLAAVAVALFAANSATAGVVVNSGKTEEVKEEAKADRAAGSGPSPYTECGIGAALFPTVPVGAVISNVIWDLGSTALTSALASPQTCNARKVKTATLILETLPALEKDITLGGGEYISALTDSMGCAADSVSTVTSNMQQGYASVLKSDSYENASQVERATTMYNVVKASANGHCAAVL